jgi:ribose 5-phosphate isomerase B
MTRIAIGCDHAGFELKTALLKYSTLEGEPMEWTDVGTFTLERVDYPDYAVKVSREILAGKADWGVLICGTGVGICMAANRIKGIRAAVIFSDHIAELTRRHNNANVACFSGRIFTEAEAARWLGIFLKTPFDGGRHLRRVQKLDE